jgi:hypothetical protein
MKFFISLSLVLFVHIHIYAQVNFTKSDLPIILINTQGKEIQDDPKIIAKMSIIYNGPGVENKVTDTPNEYNGLIGIEFRGSSSQQFPKKPFGLETITADGENNNVSLLGMPEENDWILNATYNDKSLMRDMLAYVIGGSIMDYTTRGRYCELVINGQYEGVYVFMEKIKRDKNRVDIKNIEPVDISGDKLTGGYILKIDKETGSNSGEGWISPYKPYPNAWQNTFFQLEFPKIEDINSQQKAYIQNHINKVENSIIASNFKDPLTGYRQYIDTKSLMDYIIMNELTKNPDAYRLSTFFYKDRDSEGGKIKFGPIWDFNLGFGNVDYCTQGDPNGLVINSFNNVCRDDYWVVHFWWNRFLQDESFYKDLKLRWKELRTNQLSKDRMHFVIDSIALLVDQSKTRNFQKWPILGQYVWPNYFVGNTYQEEVNYLKNWVNNRIDYLDIVWKIDSSNIEESPNSLFTFKPNPAADNVQIQFYKEFDKDISIQLFNIKGQKFEPKYSILNKNLVNLDISMLPIGLFLLQVNDGTNSFVEKIVKQ